MARLKWRDFEMYKLRICLEVNGIAEDEHGNPCPAGICLEMEYTGEKTISPEKYKENMNRVSISAVLKAASLDNIVKPENCRLITPEEYDERYGEVDDEE